MDAGRGNDRRGRASTRARRVRVALIALLGVVACACALTGAHAGRVLGRRLSSLDVDDGEEARETSAMASKEASATTSSVGTASAGETTKPTATVTEASAGDAEEDGEGDGEVKLKLIPKPARETITKTTTTTEKTTEKDEDDEKPVVASVSSASSSKTTKVDDAADVEEPAKTTKSSTAPKATMVTVEDVDEEDPEDSITQGEGAKEVNEADEAFDSQPVEKTMKKSSSSSKSVDSARAAEGEAEKDTEGDVSAESEEDPEAATAALKEAVEKQLSTLYEEPTKKQKTWVERVKAIHEVEGATSFTESEEACGSTGGLAVFTIWGHVPDVVRDAITTFIGESASKSKSEFSLLSLRAKALQLVKAYDVTFKGTGAERTDCIANYFTRQKVHEVLAHIDRAKEEKVARAHETFDHTLLDDEEDTSPEALKIRDLRIGRVSKEIKKTIMMTLAKAGISGGEDGEDAEEENVHGTAIVLALNCRAKHPHRLVAAVAHAIRAKFGLKVGDFSIVIGKKAVEDELTMFGASYASLMSERSNAAPGAESHPAETKLCPELLGTIPPDEEEEPERELSAMEKAMLEAEEHVLLEHQGRDPTNPHHMGGGAGLSMGRLPGMPNVFDGTKRNDAKRGPNNAREEARAHFGLSDQQLGTHNTDYLRNPSRTYGTRASSQPRQRVQGGFNALPKMTDPLDAYLKGDSRPKRYAEPTRA